LDVALVDARKRREPLTIVAAMVHQPVLRLFVGIEEPLRCNVGSQGRSCGGEHAARQQRDADRTIALCHESLPFCDGACPFPVLRSPDGAQRNTRTTFPGLRFAPSGLRPEDGTRRLWASLHHTAGRAKPTALHKVPFQGNRISATLDDTFRGAERYAQAHEL